MKYYIACSDGLNFPVMAGLKRYLGVRSSHILYEIILWNTFLKSGIIFKSTDLFPFLSAHLWSKISIPTEIKVNKDYYYLNKNAVWTGKRFWLNKGLDSTLNNLPLISSLLNKPISYPDSAWILKLELKLKWSQSELELDYAWNKLREACLNV